MFLTYTGKILAPNSAGTRTILMTFFIVFISHSRQMLNWHLGYDYMFSSRHHLHPIGYRQQSVPFSHLRVFLYIHLHPKYHLLLLIVLHNSTLCRISRKKLPNFPTVSNVCPIRCLAVQFNCRFPPHYRLASTTPSVSSFDLHTQTSSTQSAQVLSAQTIWTLLEKIYPHMDVHYSQI